MIVVLYVCQDFAAHEFHPFSSFMLRSVVPAHANKKTLTQTTLRKGIFLLV